MSLRGITVPSICGTFLSSSLICCRVSDIVLCFICLYCRIGTAFVKFQKKESVDRCLEAAAGCFNAGKVSILRLL